MKNCKNKNTKLRNSLRTEDERAVYEKVHESAPVLWNEMFMLDNLLKLPPKNFSVALEHFTLFSFSQTGKFPVYKWDLFYKTFLLTILPTKIFFHYNSDT